MANNVGRYNTLIILHFTLKQTNKLFKFSHHQLHLMMNIAFARFKEII